MNLKQIILSLLILAISACSYHIQKGSGGLGDLAKTQGGKARIYVPISDNLSSEAGPEMMLTSSLREVLSTLPDVILVQNPDQADYFLLTRITDWGRFATGTSKIASAEDQAMGGLIQGQSSAADIKVFLNADFELLENLQTASSSNQKIQKSLWVRQLSEERSFEAFRRFDELSGSSSAPQIHRSREELQLRKITQSLARQVLDQVTQDF